jgi:hypothetical protein
MDADNILDTLQFSEEPSTAELNCYLALERARTNALLSPIEESNSVIRDLEEQLREMNEEKQSHIADLVSTL